MGQTASWTPSGESISTLGSVVIGSSTASSYALEVVDTSGWSVIGISGTGGGILRFYQSTAGTNLKNADFLYTAGDFNWNRYNDDWSGGVNLMTLTNGGYLGIGTQTPVHPLQVVGTIGATEVIVSATGADYVFDPGYRLMPLAEVAAFIKATHHLPEIPSAKEVKEKGVPVGEMETKLLAKVEELTLQMIRMNEDNQKLKKRLEKLEKGK